MAFISGLIVLRRALPFFCMTDKNQFSEKITREAQKAREMGLENYLAKRRTTLAWYLIPVIAAAGFLAGAILF